MSIEVNGVKFQPSTSNIGTQGFNANGNITTEAKAEIKKVEEPAVDIKVKSTVESEKTEFKPVENNSANRERIQKLLDDINSAMYSYNKELHFSVNEQTRDLVVKVVNGKTGEVIQQYPSQEIVDLREKLLAGKTAGLGIESEAN